MRAYVMTTGAIFALIVVAHAARLIAEGPRLATEPVFILLTAASVALCGWSWRVWRSLPRA
jgi:hypothetical protein